MRDPLSDRQVAAEEMLRRRVARGSLAEFTAYTYPRYRAEPAHQLIAAALDRVVRGEITRLMVFAPPQHGKSELVSVRLPALWLGKHPDDPVIIASYAASLAQSKSRQARAVVESPAYRALFPASCTDAGSRAVDHWSLASPHRGGLLAAGVGGPITGHGALLGIIDDPHENWEQAHSETMRDRVDEWYRGTFRTRIWPAGAIVLIMTRWHADDLAGRLLVSQPDAWTVLRLPALAEDQSARDAACARMGLPAGQPDPLGRTPGEPLCPSRFPVDALEEIRRDVGTRAWNAEYQADPTPGEGTLVRRGWLRVAEPPEERPAALVRYWDKAATVDGCRTAGVLMARYADGRVAVLDVVAGRWTPADRDRVMLATARRDGPGVPIWIEQEPGSAGIDAMAAAIRLLAGFAVRGDRATGAKDVRLDPFLAYLEAGQVTLAAGPWNGAYVDELCALPSGAFRDQADATAGAFNRLRQAGSPGGPAIVRAPDPLEEMDRQGF